MEWVLVACDLESVRSGLDLRSPLPGWVTLGKACDVCGRHL